MLSQRIANIAYAILLAVACGYFAWVAEGFTATGLLASSGLPSKFFPQLLLGLTIACTCVVLYNYMRHGSDSGDADETVYASPRSAMSGLLVLAIAVAGFVLWPLIGFLPTALLMAPLCGLAMGVRSIPIYITLLVMPVVIYLVFTYLLNVKF
ncbi:MAG: tripartite tricarboxylate transporter TctB family protein [Rhodobacterales bacterium]